LDPAPWAESDPTSSWSNRPIMLINEESAPVASGLEMALIEVKLDIKLSILGDEMNSS